MTNFLLKSIPPQSAKVYGFLTSHDARSAKEIAKALNIFPHAVYKAIQPILELGLVYKLPGYPTKFQARPMSEAVNIYSSVIGQNFLEAFGKHQTRGKTFFRLELNFIQTRKERLEFLYKDTATAKAEINLIASGLEVPAEMILAYKRAMERGVIIRIIVQNLNEVNQNMLNNWKRLGVAVKYSPGIGARIYIFDREVLYLSSYDSEDKREAIGVRFAYAPIAKLMDELFEQRWKAAKDISSVK